MENFKLATFNVHQWVDASYSENVDRVTALIKKHDPDLVCLQEASAEDFPLFKEQNPQYPYGFKHHACAIFSKTVMKKKEAKNIGARSVTAEIELYDGSILYLTSLHLDHKLEPRRMTEIQSIEKKLEAVFKANGCQIWTGDFNALTRKEYSEERWDEITRIRHRNHWELPQTDLTTKVKSLGFKDTWEMAGNPDEIKTCRFDTRIDYIFANEPLLQRFRVEKVKVIDDNASDHNMVLATFKKSQ